MNRVLRASFPAACRGGKFDRDASSGARQTPWKGFALKPTRFAVSLAPGVRLLASVALAAACAAPAHATLGQNLASVEADRVQMQASVRHTNRASYSMHELTLANKGVVREYASPEGVVFAVTWHSPAMPDLHQLLGTHFDALAQTKDRLRGGLGHYSASTDQVVFTNNGRMRSFHGSAYLIHALPNGVSVNDIQ